MLSACRIHALPLHLANQIAAGEVVERPASVLKELLENSIDAGATHIDIHIEGAGSKLIKVTDNGSGIHPDDLSLALSRHATSKLYSSDQLSQIASLGFRGEALPSIASVSQLTLTSHAENTDLAWQIKGENNQVTPTSHPKGTSIEVRDLFFNLPARRHFLRSNKTEQHHLLTTLYRLALSQFNIEFNCTFSGANPLRLPVATTSQQQQQRIAKLCGRPFSNNTIFIDQHYDDIHLSGWIGNINAHRAQTDVQYFFINGRVIRDRVISHAVKQAYNDIIPAGRQSAYVLYLNLPLDRVDINVHPTKHEVRFRDARLIHGLIHRAITEALNPENEVAIVNASSRSIAEQTNLYQIDLAQKTSLNKSYQQTVPPNSNNIIALLHQKYVIVQADPDPLLINLQAAEYQYKTQQLQQAITNGTLRSRPILVPIKLTVDLGLLPLANQFSDTLNKLGIQLENSHHALLIKTVPTLLAQADIKQLIIDLLHALKNNKTDITQLIIILNNHFPRIKITSIDHAKQLLTQFDNGEITPSCCLTLDQQTLTSLF